MLKLTFIAWLGIDIEDIVILSIWLLCGVSIVDVDVDSISAIEALSRTALRGIGECHPKENLGGKKFW